MLLSIPSVHFTPSITDKKRDKGSGSDAGSSADEDADMQDAEASVKDEPMEE